MKPARRPVSVIAVPALLLGLAPAGAAPTVAVEGTALRVTFDDGRIVSGRALAGATLTLALAGAPDLQRIRLDRIEPDPDDDGILLYRITVLPTRPDEVTHDLCEADANGKQWAFPLRGQWDTNGRRLSASGITLACAGGGAIGKCVAWGYKPWAKSPSGASLAPYHATCVNMVRANYCGNAGTTRNGMMIDYWDAAGIHAPDDVEATRLAAVRSRVGTRRCALRRPYPRPGQRHRGQPRTRVPAAAVAARLSRLRRHGSGAGAIRQGADVQSILLASRGE